MEEHTKIMKSAMNKQLYNLVEKKIKSRLKSSISTETLRKDKTCSCPWSLSKIET